MKSISIYLQNMLKMLHFNYRIRFGEIESVQRNVIKLTKRKCKNKLNQIVD